jgi:ABC-type glycerol-3-phosphate transport system substrate-binding protein
MKRLLAVLLALALVLLAAGCSKKAETAGGGEPQITITLATSVYVEDPHRIAMDALLDAYKRVAPNVTVEIYGGGWATYWDNVTTEIMGNNEADIMQIYPENVATYHNLRPGGVFVNLNQYMNGQDYVSRLTGQDMCEFNGETLALSNYAWGTTGLFYRKSILADSGIDPDSIKTWNDFVAVSAELKKKGIFGMGVISSAHSFVVSIWARMLGRVVSNGLYFPNGETGPFTADNIQVNNPANLWAAQQWQDYLLKNEYGKSAPDPKDMREYFYNGLAAFCYDGPWYVGMIREYDASLINDVGIIPAPAVEYNGTLHQPNPTMYPLVMALSKNCKYPQEAWNFMNWMASDEAQKISATSGMIPASVEYSNSAEYKTDHPQSSLFAEILKTYGPQVADPFIAQQGELSQIMVNAAQEMFIAGADARTVLDRAAESCKEVMNR